MSKYNIVLITIESLRADFVGYQNSKEQNTPFLDKLAKSSFVYTNAIASGIPTFAHFPSLMTGRMPFSYGHTLGISSDKNNKTIAEVLKKNGYKTIAVLGDTPQLYSFYNFNRGFDIYLDGFDRSTSELFLINAIWNVKQKLPQRFDDMLDYLRAATKVLSKSPPPHIPGRDLNQKIIKTLSQNSKDPFFLWVHYMDTHYPYTSGIDKIKGTVQKIIYYKKLVKYIIDLKIDNPEFIEQVKEVYRGCIAELDAVLRQLFELITKKYPNTIFIITSDHGEAFMEHGEFGHEATSLYNELIKIPLLINFPSKKSKKIEDIVSTVSLAKTICSILNIKNTEFKGTDITEDNNDLSENHISKILYNCISPSIKYQIFDNKTEMKGFTELVSYTTKKYKYIVEKGGNKEELYDLEKDPGEKENIIDTVPKKTIVELRNKLNNE